MAEHRPIRVELVFAHWCPHCVPLSIGPATRLAQHLGVPLRTLDIDRPKEEAEADELVRSHGDWTDDYLIPQAFLSYANGRVEHLLTGIPGPTSGTAAAWRRVLERFGVSPETP